MLSNKYARAIILTTGLLFLGYIYIFSGIVISILVIVTLPIRFIKKSLHRRVAAALAYSHWSQIVFFALRWSKSKCIVHCYEKDKKYFGNETAIVLLNHKYEIDWLMGWILADQYGMLGTSKVYVKDSLRFVPFFGWLWMATETIFLKRDWKKDQVSIPRDIRNLYDYPLDFWLLLFAEGTRFTEEKFEASVKFSKERGLPVLKHHLLPRTKGFNLTIQGAQGGHKISSVYNACVYIPTSSLTQLHQEVPKNASSAQLYRPTISSILLRKPIVSHMFARRIPISSIPVDEEGCSQWLYDAYKEKDELYDNFMKTGKFSDDIVPADPPKAYTDIYNFVMWSVLLGLPLCHFIKLLIFNASATFQLSAIAIVALTVLLVRAMISVTEIKKSASAYGRKSTNLNNNVPDTSSDSTTENDGTGTTAQWDQNQNQNEDELLVPSDGGNEVLSKKHK